MRRIRLMNADESGATLILALIFVVVLGVVISVLTTLSGTNLSDLAQLQGQREQQYAAIGVVDAEIQAIRKLATSAGGKNGGNTTQTCQSFPTTGTGLTVTQDVNQMTVVATCTAFAAVRTASLQVTNSSNQLQVPLGGSYQFSAADVGQWVIAYGVPSGTTITSVSSATSATMSQSAGSAACLLSSCTESVNLQTPTGQRLVLLQGCLGTSCTGETPLVKAVVRYYDQAANGSPSPGTGVTVQNWIVQAANH